MEPKVIGIVEGHLSGLYDVSEPPFFIYDSLFVARYCHDRTINHMMNYIKAFNDLLRVVIRVLMLTLVAISIM